MLDPADLIQLIQWTKQNTLLRSLISIFALSRMIALLNSLSVGIKLYSNVQRVPRVHTTVYVDWETIRYI